MFRTSLLEIAGNQNQDTGKKAGSKGTSNSLKNNFEFQKILRDVESEMNVIRIGAQGRVRSDAHPKMGKTLELVCELVLHWLEVESDSNIPVACPLFSGSRG